MPRTTAGPRTVRAATGSELRCLGWPQEAALRMLENNLDPEVAEKPDELIVYGGTGRAARNWECFETIVATLKRLRGDETLLVQSGKPVGVFRTHEDAPRVLIANSLLVPAWATGEEFRRLEGLGLTMYGQMTAGSWIYIGSQGIVQGTYETFAAAAARHFGGDLFGRLVVTAGLGGMGGAQPLAATMNGATALIAEADGARIDRRIATRYLDVREDSLDRAIDRALEARDARRAVSIGVKANAVDLLERLLARGAAPDLVTDQTSAHDELDGYVPTGAPDEDLTALRRADPERYIRRSYESMARHMRALLEWKRRGAVVFDYGNNLRGQAKKAGVEDAFDIGGFVPLFIRPLFCEGKGPFRWAALSGDPEDIRTTDAALLDLFPKDAALRRWLTL
ncbi:MAG TPA: urocanate hydratase, partial [Thermoanaerobaculia bacterium]|nr:urocanate hydratase [Thermoanaerobaculia bacterium]